MSRIFIIVLIAVTAILTCPQTGAADRTGTAPLLSTIDGAVLFVKMCSECHGRDGRGSELATFLSPPVTDLLLPPFKHGSGREAVIRVVRDGLGTSMLSYRYRLSDQQIQSVADYVIRLRDSSLQAAQ